MSELDARLDAVLATAPVFATVDGPVVVGCSGGPDSLALLALAVRAGWQPTAVHVDHGLRPGSATEFAVVEAAARACGVSARTVRVDVESGPNLEARARDARLAALSSVADELGIDHIALAHTLDDQAETVLMAVVRGSGTPGLSAMAARRGRFVRPLLGVRRHDVRALVAELGWTAVDDPMNHDDQFLRVWMRSTLLPLLDARTGRDLAPVLARQAALVRSESEYLDRLAAAALDAAGSPPRVRDLVALDHVVLRRVVRLWCGAPPIGGRAVEAALEVVAGARVAVELPGGRTLRRRHGCLVVETGVTD